jgi:hypothetical protein
MSAVPAQPSGGVPETPEGALPLEWAFNPWRERPGLAALAAVLALLMCTLVLGAKQSLVLTVALCLAAAGALAPAIAPLRCRVDQAGVGRRGPLGWERRGWPDIRRGVLRPNGLFVSPYRSRHPLDSYRGLFLPLPLRDHIRLAGILRSLLASHGL